MKRTFLSFGVLCLLSLSVQVNAQEDTSQKQTDQEMTMGSDDATSMSPMEQEEANAASQEQGKSIHQFVKEKFIEGGPIFMSFIFVCLILGLALAFERVIYLNLATTNNKKLLLAVEDALENGGVDAAKEVCRNTRGPVASIFYQGIERHGEGIEVMEKSIEAYGGVQMGLLEKGMTWLSLFIALAPMLGFMGTVLGMIDAFDKIAEAGGIDPVLVADGIKVALITTVSGLIVAMILQVFYNYCLTKIDSIVNNMEDASISFLDMMVKFLDKK